MESFPCTDDENWSSNGDTGSTGGPPSRSFSVPSNLLSSDKENDKLLSESDHHQKSLKCRIAQMFNKNSDSKCVDSMDINVASDVCDEDHCSLCVSFDDAMKQMEGRDQGSECPTNLPGGVLVDQLYVIAPADLNSLLFSPDSGFPKSLAEVLGSTDVQAGTWKFEMCEGTESLKRIYSCVKAATKLIKAVKATEEQAYLKADGKNFAVLSIVSTPDVMYGGTFKVELLYCITPGPELQSKEQCSHLVLSWRINFLQSTMMKGMIENGARQGLKDSFEQFATLLSETIKRVDSKDMGLNKEQLLASLKAEPRSDWKLVARYFGNLTMISTVFMGVYVLVHLWLVSPSAVQGLELIGIDFPDSVTEFIVCGVLVLQGKRVLHLISRFMQARVQKGSDHGVKGQGIGWLLTVALIEGSNLAATDSSSGVCDPYVVFTCNGKTRSSSIKFQKPDPQWNEIFEFDAMDEPPSMLDVEVYDFDGPFDEARSLGRAEINFVKSNVADLGDVWVPLKGKLARACQSKLHMRIFLDNTGGGNVVREYLSKMAKEVGKKISVRSPQTNSAFQKLFGLPPEEFLINDFTCHLKRKILLQGRLFLSARIIGFHSNLFGHKTKFFFLWEDIEEIQAVPPTLASMGSPIILMTLRPGRGVDARQGAKTQDVEGRLKFHFQSFVSFGVTHRTIMALWKARSLTNSEQKVQMLEERSESKSLQTEESGSFLGVEDVSMSEVYSAALPVPTSFFMEVFGGGELERKAMDRAGYLNYSFSPWESVSEEKGGNIYERETYYRFDRRIPRYSGEATSNQQKQALPDRNGWLIEEVMTLHGVPLGDYFNLHLRFQVEDLASRPNCCQVRVYFGIAWLKSTRHQKRYKKHFIGNLQDRLKVILAVVEKEFVAR